MGGWAMDSWRECGCARGMPVPRGRRDGSDGGGAKRISLHPYTSVHVAVD